MTPSEALRRERRTAVSRLPRKIRDKHRLHREACRRGQGWPLRRIAGRGGSASWAASGPRNGASCTRKK